MVICCVNGCHNRSDRSPTEGVSFFGLPTVYQGPDENLRQQTSDRRALWLVRVDRREISAGARVCSEHFVRGKPAPVTATNDVDWAPTLKLSDTSPSARICSPPTKKRKLSAGSFLEPATRDNSTQCDTVQLTNATTQCNLCSHESTGNFSDYNELVE